MAVRIHLSSSRIGSPPWTPRPGCHYCKNVKSRTARCGFLCLMSRSLRWQFAECLEQPEQEESVDHDGNDAKLRVHYQHHQIGAIKQHTDDESRLAALFGKDSQQN